jgi:dipeptidase E
MMEISGIYIGGGDTVKLLKEVRETHFDKYLRDVAQSGIPIYGGSAGAIILGDDIRTAPEAKHLTKSEAKGLNIIKGYSIVCHYRLIDEEAVRNLSKTFQQYIIAVSEKNGAYIAGKTLINYGTEPIHIFREDREYLINPNCTIELDERR